MRTVIVAILGLVVGFTGTYYLGNSVYPNISNYKYLDTFQDPNLTPIPQKEGKVSVRALNLTKANIVTLYSEVNKDSVNTLIKDIHKFNNTTDKPIYLLIDSPGGSVIDGARLIAIMQASKNPVFAINVGVSASMAFMILQHAHKRYALSKSILMAHPASLGIMYQGELDKAVSRFSFLKRYVDNMDKFVAKRAGMTYEAFKTKSNQELWAEGADAVAEGLVDELVSLELPVGVASSASENKLKQKINMK